MLKLLKRLIKASGKTKKQIAREIGVNATAVHAWLRGAKGINKEHKERIKTLARRYGITKEILG